MNYQQIQAKIAAALPHDKCLHAIGGQVIALATLWLGVPASLCLVASIAMGKEAYDYMHPASHSAEVWDAVATVFGAIPVWGLYLVLSHG